MLPDILRRPEREEIPARAPRSCCRFAVHRRPLPRKKAPRAATACPAAVPHDGGLGYRRRRPDRTAARRQNGGKDATLAALPPRAEHHGLRATALMIWPTRADSQGTPPGRDPANPGHRLPAPVLRGWVRQPADLPNDASAVTEPASLS